MAEVSIPNEMEFYLTLGVNPRTAQTRFNSQQDGILHDTRVNKYVGKKRFNSQRDGILQHAIDDIREQ